MKPVVAIYGFWAVWVLTWMAGALLAPPTLRNRNTPLVFVYRLLVLAGYSLLFGLYNRYDTQYRLWDTLTGPVGWTMAVIVVAAFALCWWARIQYGFQWTSEPEAKPSIRFVATGPYRLIRHPYYTGIVLAAAGTAVVQGTPSAVAGVIVLAGASILKGWLEEADLAGESGLDAFTAYKQRGPAVGPFKLSLSQSPTPTRQVAPSAAAPVADPAPAVAVAAAPAEAKTEQFALDLFAGADAEDEPAAENTEKPEPAPDADTDTLDLFTPSIAAGLEKEKPQNEDGAHPALSKAISITKR